MNWRILSTWPKLKYFLGSAKIKSETALKLASMINYVSAKFLALKAPTFPPFCIGECLISGKTFWITFEIITGGYWSY